MPARHSRSPYTRRRVERGQVLVVFVLGLLAIVAGVAVVVDGGNAFAQQRVTQNAVDASADAGAAVLLNNVATQVAGTLPETDADVLNAVDTIAAKNSIATPTAYYTTISGNCILSDGTSAAPPCNNLANAVQVGSGAIPTVGPDASGNPQCPLPYYTSSGTPTPFYTPASACGVAAYGSKTFQTYVAGAIGISQLTASAAATAVAGAQVTVCPAGSPCGFLPVTFPTSLTVCGSTNKYDLLHQLPYLVIDTKTTALTSQNESIIQICGTGPGSVGWLAIQPEDKNGVSDLAADIATPDNPPLFLPLWVNAQTGNTNDPNVENAMNSYAGQVVGMYEPGKDQTVTIPLYDCTADVKVVGGQQNPATNPAECSGLSAKDLNGGSGANLYYHVPSIAGFVLDHAYINGDNSAECNNPPSTIGTPLGGGNGATGCLVGWFVDISSPSTAVGTGFGNPTSAFGVQLIR
jgi:Flp pilus assembly protein TadG